MFIENNNLMMNLCSSIIIIVIINAFMLLEIAFVYASFKYIFIIYDAHSKREKKEENKLLYKIIIKLP